MPRSLFVPGVFFLAAATVLLVITSISVPYFKAIDITRVHFHEVPGDPRDVLTLLRLGIWGYCQYGTQSGRICIHEHPYTVPVGPSSVNGLTVHVSAAWTRGLAIHPVAAVAAFVAFLLSLSSHLTATLLASIISFLTAVITLIAFAIDIALYALVKHEMNKLDTDAQTVTGPGFWLTFVSFILLVLAGCTVCFGRRRDSAKGVNSSSGTPFWEPLLERLPFRKNRW